MQETSKDAAQADINLEYVHNIAGFCTVNFKSEIGDPNYLTAVDIDDLLIEQIAGDAQHVLVVMIGNELLFAQRDAVAERDGADLIVADGEPGVGAADQKTIDAGGMDKRNQGCVLNAADSPASDIEHRHAK